ncbi:peptidyl-tRNA hydrolase 2, mitochondrial-like [Diorhabda carinulata]|uniref:peptidyl-tRNA hydrolase 2, mitochondrial-like n=1 Tax=Diorhabda carinulata TaxID=1163345 RepID=UPI0025A29D3F|nr:peptidyl-tRNA hydrolase 2, mitochondrial-like [Diorhabda carinulata]
MGIITSSSLTIFSAGIGIGVTSAYFILRFKPKHRSSDDIWKNEMEERYEFEDPKDEYRLIMGVRNDLKMQKGKVAAQCGHAAVAAYAKSLKERPILLKKWLRYGGTKIAVRVDSEEELLTLHKAAQAENILSSIIRDAGQTQVAPGSRTVIAIGPAPKSALDKVTGHLKLY